MPHEILRLQKYEHTYTAHKDTFHPEHGNVLPAYEVHSIPEGTVNCFDRANKAPYQAGTDG